ncbi:MAG TPA: Gldg family protein [Chloroflexia bacterium]|nr:Gldg family protein [Chloroflexia bacterium]
MSRALIKQIGRLAGFLAVPLAIVLVIGLVAVRKFDWYILVGLIVLLALIAIFAVTNPDTWQHRLGRQRVSSAISGIVVIIALVGIIALVNVLLYRTNIQFDLTKNQTFTISPTSEQVINKLNQNTTATIFYSSQTQDQQVQANDLLKQYASRTDKLSIQTVNADADPIAVQKFNVTAVPAVVFAQGDKHEQVSTLDEQNFTRALLKLENPTQRRVLVVTGHQELPTTSSQSGSSLSAAMQALSDNNYKVEIYNSATNTSTPFGGTSSTTNATPSPTTLNPANDILLIAGPRGKFSDDEKNRITTFLKQGGKALVAYDIAGNVDAAQATNLNDLLSDWNVKFNRGVIVETDPNLRSPQNPTYLAPQVVTGSDITSNLQNETVFVLQSTDVEKGSNANSAATFTELLKTGDNSYLKTTVPPQTAEFEQGDKRGPLVVGAAVEEPAKEKAATPSTTPGATATPALGATAGTTPAATPTATAAASGNAANQALNARIVLLGSSSAISDVVLSQSKGNYDFFINAMNYLNESANNVVIPAKLDSTQPFSINQSQSTFTFWASFLGLPLVILFAGLAVWWRRR